MERPVAVRATPSAVRAIGVERVLDHPYALVAALAVASRVLAVVTLVAADRTLGPDVPAWRSVFGMWDGGWFDAIALTGYHAEAVQTGTGIGYHDFAFFPAWPALLWMGAQLGGLDPMVFGAVLSNVLFVLACLAAYRAFAPRFGETSAVVGTALLAFAPSAFTFSLAYSESLFLLLAAVAFTVAGTRLRWALAFCAQLTRLPGVALSATALAGPLAERRWPDRRELLTLLAAPVAFLLWWGFIIGLTGDVAGYLLGTPAWHATANQPSGPLSWLPAGDATDALRILAGLGLAIPIAGTVVLAVDRRLELCLFSVVTLAPGLLWANWMSVPRYALMALPAYLAFGDRLPRRWAVALVALSAAGQVLFAALAVQRQFVP